MREGRAGGSTDAGGSTTGPTEPKPAAPGTQPAPARPRWRDLANPGLRRLLIAAAVLSLVTIGDGFLYLALESTGDISAAYFPLLFVGTNFAYLSLAVPMASWPTGSVAARCSSAATSCYCSRTASRAWRWAASSVS